MYPASITSPVDLRRYAALVDRSGAGRLWGGQSVQIDLHQALALTATTGRPVPVGSAVSLMSLDHPYHAALQARSVAGITGRPFVAGYGVGGHPSIGTPSRSGGPWRPTQYAAEFLSILRGLLDGAWVSHDGEHYTVEARLAAMDHPAVEVGLGVLRPGLARTAGRVADVAITWLTTAGYVRDVIMPAIATGAQERRRRPRVVTILPFAIARPGRDPAQVVLAGNGAHLQQPHYVEVLRRQGVTVDPQDPARTASSFLEQGVLAWGTPQDIAEQISTYGRAGVDEIALSPGGVLVSEGPDAAIRDLQEVLAAVSDG